MYAIQRSVHASGSNAAALIADGFCFKCMKDAGVKADENLALPKDVDAGALRAAEYSLKDVASARGCHICSTSHPLRTALYSTRSCNWRDIQRQTFEKRVSTLES